MTAARRESPATVMPRVPDPLAQVVEILEEALDQLAGLRDRIVVPAALELIEVARVPSLVLAIDRTPRSQLIQVTAERLRCDLESVISPESVRDDILRQTSTQNALVLEEHAHDPLIDVGVFHTRVRDDRLSFKHTLPLALRDAFSVQQER